MTAKRSYTCNWFGLVWAGSVHAGIAMKRTAKTSSVRYPQSGGRLQVSGTVFYNCLKLFAIVILPFGVIKNNNKLCGRPP